ncbi:hypothetical protein [Duganella violaceipulchra]|uniref:Uncharacterized protein n=1 Tax=Duganella violaceipulchra TaxID=2849652 RepID=A0AA41H8X5_9BURK|nr:hypothetical protein [Duganella violaceicalia]MBV6319746.1 hypothetical protein [Duganella violaceicalia]MCP2006441.1 hypothetical protein [Duganella violaceicalia]
MKKQLRTAVLCLPLMAALHALAAAAPAKLPLELKDRRFSVYAMEFSANGEQVCIAGADHDDMGATSGRLILVDRARNTILWQKVFPAPDDYAGIFPVQCRPSADHVYLLANVDTKSSPPITQTLTYVYSFDMKGQQIAKQQLSNPARNQYAYAMDVTQDGIKVAGYLKDVDEDFEYYSVYTVTLNASLQTQGVPVIRKNGAYTRFVSARIVGDSMYVAGTFAPAKVGKRALIDDFAASRLRLSGGYAWSARTNFGTRSGVRTGVAEDGTTYALRYMDNTTTLLTVPPGGKPLPQQSYSSRYCGTRAIAGYGKGLIAVREACDDSPKGSKNALVEIDPLTGKEVVWNSVSDEPLNIATSGSSWALVAKSKDGKLYFYSSPTGMQ